MACWLPCIILAEMTEEEGAAINIDMWSKGRVAGDREAMVLEGSKKDIILVQCIKSICASCLPQT